MIQKRLGEMLIAINLLEEEALAEALQLQKTSGERLGRILIHLGLVPEEEIIKILAKQLEVPLVHLFEEMDIEEVQELIPQTLIKKYRIVPVRQIANRLLVAMVDPLNILAIDDLQQVTGLEIEPAIASEEEIESFIGQYHGLQELANQASLESGANNITSQSWEIFDPTHDEALMIRLVNSIMSQGVRMRASDIHIEACPERVRVRYRVDGILREMMELPLGLLPPLVSRIKIMAGMDITEKRMPQDGRLQLKTKERLINLRIATIPTLAGEKIVARILDRVESLILLENLGFSPKSLTQYRQLIKNTHGMILITGPTGSGKTSTLYATLNDLNSPDKNIMTIEEPVEYVLAGINQIRVTAKPGLDFATGLRSVLRQDPDIIMVGEVRDQETAEIAVRAAITGHLVFSTLHTVDAAGAITRLLDMGIEPFLVASSVRAVVAQRLVRRLCTHCQELYRPEIGSEEALFLDKVGFPLGQVARGLGCRHCEHTGYKGRLAILEILPIQRELRQKIMNREPRDELKRVALSNGMLSLQEDGIAKSFERLTTIAEIMRVAYADES